MENLYSPEHSDQLTKQQVGKLVHIRCVAPIDISHMEDQHTRRLSSGLLRWMRMVSTIQFKSTQSSYRERELLPQYDYIIQQITL